MRQLNNKQFDTKQGANPMSHRIPNSSLVSIKKDETKMKYKSSEEIDKAINYVYKLAKSDKGMTALDTVRFHLFNPNGNYTLCREWGWKAYEKGGFYFGVNAGSWHYDQLSKLLDMKKPRWWKVHHLIDELLEDAIDWAEKVKEVENRTDEEKAWVEKNLGGK
jgi:hypothetical protein